MPRGATADTVRGRPDLDVQRHPVTALAWALPAISALALTAWRYDSKPLWRDEVFTLATSTRPLGAMQEALSSFDGGLTVYYLLMHVWTLPSSDPHWLRLPSAASAVIGAALLGALGRRLAGPAAGASAGVLFAFTPIVMQHTQEARPYPLVLALLILTAYAFQRYRETPSTRWLLTWSIAALLAGTVHVLPGGPAVAAIAAASFLFPGNAARLRIALAAAPAAAGVLLMVAVGADQGVNERQVNVAQEVVRLRHFYGGTTITVLLLAALAALGIWHLRRDRFAVTLLLTWTVVPVAAITALGFLSGFFQPRYTEAAAPALALLAGAGIAAVAGRLASARAIAVAATVLTVAVVAGQVPSLVQFRTAPYYTDDAPAVAAYLERNAQPGDAVVYTGRTGRPLLALSLPRTSGLDDALLVAPAPAGPRIEGLELPEEERAQALASYRRVWLVGTTTGAPWPSTSTNVQAARAGRVMVEDFDGGQTRAELWQATLR